MKKPLVIGIAGGSGSGKSTVANKLLERLTGYSAITLDQDSYYKHYKNHTLEDRKKLNFDHPDAIDFELMCYHLEQLIQNRAVEKPIYDFKVSNRSNNVTVLEPAKVILVEGILIFDNPHLRGKMDRKIFVQTDDDIRFIRRLTRDVKERGRTIENVIEQYTKQVRPMHLTFVEPTKRYADVIIPKGGHNDIAINMVIADILYKLNNG